LAFRVNSEIGTITHAAKLVLFNILKQIFCNNFAGNPLSGYNMATQSELVHFMGPS
jgi:hypothetical protein